MDKNYLTSKTFWASVCIAVGVVGTYLNGTIDLTQLIMGVGGALGLFGIRSALK